MQRVLLLLSGTTTMQPAPIVPERYTREESSLSLAGIWDHGVDPHSPMTSVDVGVRHLKDALWTMSPLVALPLHAHTPLGAVHAPEVTMSEVEALLNHRHEPLAIRRSPDEASTANLRSVD